MDNNNSEPITCDIDNTSALSTYCDNVLCPFFDEWNNRCLKIDNGSD